jgi:hypothetical protein
MTVKTRRIQQIEVEGVANEQGIGPKVGMVLELERKA